MLGRSSCCAPKKTCYNNTYDDYEELSQKVGGGNGFNSCRPSFKENLCNRIKRVQESSKILENVLDISSTLVKIMCVCGIHECKANKALDVIIYAFMHFDEVSEHPGGKCKKRIRKEEFYNDLMKDCGMTKAEAKLTYSIVKCAFKAFYHKQIVNKYDAGFVDQCEWKNAANRTITAFAESGASKSEVELTGRRILCAYENYMCRLQTKKDQKSNQDENKCICNKSKRESMNYGGSPCQHSQQPAPCAFPPEPPLCGELCCQIICPPGATSPQLVCKDVCGRTFLKVDGNRVNFDPFVMEAEARRAAMRVCPPSDADRIRSLRQSLDVCGPKETDSCDRILAEICKDNEEPEDICDEIDEFGERSPTTFENGDSDNGGDGYNGSPGENSGAGGDGDYNQIEDIVPPKREDGIKSPKVNTTDNQKVNETNNRKEKMQDNRKEKTQDNRNVNEIDNRRPQPPPRSLSPTGQNNVIDVMSITIRFDKQSDGNRRMEVDMQGYGPDGTSAPDNIKTLRVIANNNAPLDFGCSLISDNFDAKSTRSMQSRARQEDQRSMVKSTVKPELPPAESTPRLSHANDTPNPDEMPNEPQGETGNDIEGGVEDAQ